MTLPLPLRTDRQTQYEKWRQLSREASEGGWSNFPEPKIFEYFYLNQLAQNNEFQQDPPLTEKQLEAKTLVRLTGWKEKIDKNKPPFEIGPLESKLWGQTFEWDRTELSYRGKATGSHYSIPGVTPKTTLEAEPGRRI